MRKLGLILALLAVTISSAASAQTAQPVVGAVPANTVDARQQAFEIVWRTVKEKHFDPTFGGVDWDKIKEQYAPRVASVKSDAEFYQLLQQMLGELHQSHFNIIPIDVAESENSHGSREGTIGIDLRIIDSQAVITRVEPSSKAALAGLRTGFIIKQVDGKQTDQIIQRYAKTKMSAGMANLYMTRAVLSLVEGPPSSSTRIAYIDEKNQTREVVVERQPLAGDISPAFGNFPPQHVEFEAKRLAGGIGYIRFNIFINIVMDKIRAALRSMKDAPGIIIDLRGNPGGMGGMASGIAGYLETRQTSLGVMKMRVGYNNFAVFPQEGAYTGPVVLLIDGLSASTSEVFAGGMQEIERATVIGERSAGAALPSIIQRLPTGALFQYAIADYKTPKGVLIEGRGVVPNLDVKLTRSALLEGRDSQIEAAIEQIKKKVTGDKNRNDER